MNALERLRAVLCAPDGEVVIDGTDADRSIVAEALKELDAALSRTAGVADGWRTAVEALVRHIESETCTHEETHRGGAIWEICDSCGAQWADDRGGRPEFTWPECVENARSMLAAAPAASGGEDAVKAKYPEAYAYHWPDRWTIYAARHGSMQGHALGDGATKAKAWEAASLAIPQSPAGASVSERAREILSQAYRDAGFDKAAEWVLQVDLDNELYVLDRAVIRALEQALTQQRGSVRPLNTKPENGWTFDPAFLERVMKLAEQQDSGEFAPSLEGVETVLLALQAMGTTPQPGAEALRELQDEIDRLNAIINTPQANDFLRAVSTEAEHQRQRWGTDHDAGKEPADWFWLVGYLAGKALHAHAAGDVTKAEHHIITTAGALANWHLAAFGNTDMRPGIDGESLLARGAE